MSRGIHMLYYEEVTKMNKNKIYENAEAIRNRNYMEFLELDPETRAIWQAVRFQQNLNEIITGLQPKKKSIFALLKERFGK